MSCPTVPPLREAPVSEWIRQHVLRAVGLSIVSYAELEQAVEDKCDPRLVDLADARFRMGHLRYGVCGYSPSIDMMDRAEQSIAAYKATRNRDHIIDLLNWARLEWVHPSMEGTYYHAEDRDD